MAIRARTLKIDLLNGCNIELAPPASNPKAMRKSLKTLQ
jgi:hypothetical protein